MLISSESLAEIQEIYVYKIHVAKVWHNRILFTNSIYFASLENQIIKHIARQMEWWIGHTHTHPPMAMSHASGLSEYSRIMRKLYMILREHQTLNARDTILIAPHYALLTYLAISHKLSCAQYIEQNPHNNKIHILKFQNCAPIKPQRQYKWESSKKSHLISP